MQRPHRPYATPMRQFRNDRRQLRMDIVKVNYIRFEVIKQLAELVFHLA